MLSPNSILPATIGEMINYSLTVSVTGNYYRSPIKIAVSVPEGSGNAIRGSVCSISIKDKGKPKILNYEQFDH